MDEPELSLLRDAVKAVSIAPADTDVIDRVRAGHEHFIDFIIENRGISEISWPSVNPVNLAYRWFYTDPNGAQMIEGERAHLSEFLRPKEPQTVPLKIKVPNYQGPATLRVSCVCEGAFWFYDLFQTGWIDFDVNIVPAVRWPVDFWREEELKPWRGSVVAALLQRNIDHRPIRCLEPLPLKPSLIEPVPADVYEPAPQEPPVAPAPPFGHIASSSVFEEEAAAEEAIPDLNWIRHPIRSLGTYIRWLLANSPLARDIMQLRRAVAANTQQIDVINCNFIQIENTIHEKMDAIISETNNLMPAILGCYGHLDRGVELIINDRRKSKNADMSQQMEALDQIRDGLTKARDAIISEMALKLANLDARVLNSADLVEKVFALVQEGDKKLSQVALIETVPPRLAALESLIEDDFGYMFNKVDALLRSTDLVEKVFALVQEGDKKLSQVALIESVPPRLAVLEGLIETDFGHMFNKVDALLHRQIINVPDLSLVVSRNQLGLFAIPGADLETVSFFASGQLPEPGSLALLQKLLKRGSTFVDVGANVGLFTVAAGRIVGVEGRVLAFEPAPLTMASLDATVRLNGLQSIVALYPVAAGSKLGTARLNVGKICGHSSFLPLAATMNSVDVPVSALDSIIGKQKVDLIKIDVEGWEMEVLMGLDRTLLNNPNIAIIIEFAPSIQKSSGHDWIDWISITDKYGLTMYEIDEDHGGVKPIRTSGLDRVDSINLLLTRRPASELGVGQN